ncbi:MAG: hypothetical protein NC131_16955 [Roseburia sp.]|nr:hypothetical protein [Roseburia sp.]
MDKYTLMNKTHPVMDVLYDSEIKVFIGLKVIDLRYASPALVSCDGTTNKGLLNDWWDDRIVPESRMECPTAKDLIISNLGLSLSDCYWLNPGNLSWKDVNLFEHGISAMGAKLPDAKYSPVSSTGGNLNKEWYHDGTGWILVKEGSGTLKQEAINEVVATALHRRLLDYGEYVEYRTLGEKCSCRNMLKNDEELITAWDILKNYKRKNDVSPYNHMIDIFHSKTGLDIPYIEQFVSKMFMCDYIIANSDRHLNNFGFIRNVNTLQYVACAPIFDSGSSLWFDKITLGTLSDYEYRTKPFGYPPDKQLDLVKYLDWFDGDELDDYVDEVRNKLGKSSHLDEGRINSVVYGIQRNINHLIGMLSSGKSYFISAVNRMSD